MGYTTNPLCQVAGTTFITRRFGHRPKSRFRLSSERDPMALSLADVNLANLDKVQAELNNQYQEVHTEIFAVDVTKMADIYASLQSAASKFGRIDISIQGARITGFPAAMHGFSLEDWQPVIDINLAGLALHTHEVNYMAVVGLTNLDTSTRR
ncbi:hypothetical protein ASPCAL05266 [Aspergillus calidoustus]|uniref:Uncharacterized protein n=1 Tax=Aspergillus calidoustus TaxID=454130 RepID=A0A0U5FXT0_ASPCI|nr:hypothetical protein ASPCAL05266 [Aspergillus calidoustus]